VTSHCTWRLNTTFSTSTTSLSDIRISTSQGFQVSS
jgi:hypothetical protein